MVTNTVHQSFDVAAARAHEGAAAGGHRPRLRLAPQVTRSILIAGGTPAARQALLQELSAQLPPGTRFEEAEATWQMLERAGSSRMVLLAGELDGSTPEGIVQLLCSRHPQLPVVSLAASISA